MSWPSKLALCQQVPLAIGLKSEIQVSWPSKLALCQQVPLAIGLKSEFPSQKIAGDSGVVA